MALRLFTFINQTEGFPQEQAASDELSMGKISLLGVSGVAIDGGAQLASNFGDPVSATDLATKQYVDNLAAGLDIKASARLSTNAALPSYTASGSGIGKTLTATANGALSVDGVAVAVNDRVLVKDEGGGTSVHNGIYKVTAAGSAGTPYILTRATDFDQNSEVTPGSFIFIEEGTANADTGWVLVTDAPITVDTTALTFNIFSTTQSLTYDQGLIKSGLSISVEVDTAANAQGTGAGGGSSGLEFDVNTAAGKLRAAVNATGGIERTATGVAVKLNGTTLVSGASGVSVAMAPKIQNTLTADEAIVIGRAVCWSATANRVINGDSSVNAKSRIKGVSITAAAGAGNTLEVVSHGIAAGVLTGATPQVPYYLTTTGALSTSLPGGNNRIIQCLVAINATDGWVDVIDFGKKA